MERRGGQEERDRGHEVRDRNGAIKSSRLTGKSFPSVSIDNVVSSNKYGVHATLLHNSSRFPAYNNNFHVTNISME